MELLEKYVKEIRVQPASFNWRKLLVDLQRELEEHERHDTDRYIDARDADASRETDDDSCYG